MYHWTTEFIGRNILAQHALHYAGAGKPKEGVFGLDEKAALTGQITTTPRVEAEHTHDAGHDATDLAQCREGISIAIQPPNPCRNIGAGNI